MQTHKWEPRDDIASHEATQLWVLRPHYNSMLCLYLNPMLECESIFLKEIRLHDGRIVLQEIKTCLDWRFWYLRYAIARNAQGLPQNPGQPLCKNYMSTGMCKYGVGCSLDHPVRQSYAEKRSFRNTQKKAGEILGKVEATLANMSISSKSTASSQEENIWGTGPKKLAPHFESDMGDWRYLLLHVNCILCSICVLSHELDWLAEQYVSEGNTAISNTMNQIQSTAVDYQE